MSAGAVRVRVPASSANLGPGFDAFAAALDLHLTVEVGRGTFGVETDLDVPRDRSNLMVTRPITLSSEVTSSSRP